MTETILYSRLYEIIKQNHRVFSTDAGLAAIAPGTSLWIQLRDESQAQLFLCDYLRQYPEPLHRLTAEKNTAYACAEQYVQEKGVGYTIREMAAYYLPDEAGVADAIGGVLRLARREDAAYTWEWIRDFYTETLESQPPEGSGAQGAPPSPRTSPQGHMRIPQPDPFPGIPESAADSGAPTLYVWQPPAHADTRAHPQPPAAMGMILPGEKTCRLNLIYTPPQHRRKGYGKALVAALCKKIRGEGKIPMLYAYADNTVAVRLYQGLGFAEAGRLTEVVFYS